MPISRKKACIRCRMAKARCSLTSPQCSRCIERGLLCEYADQPQSRPGPYTRSADNDAITNTATTTDTIDSDVQLSPAEFLAPSRDAWLGNWDEINFGSQLASLLTPNTMFSDASLAFFPTSDHLAANEAAKDVTSPASHTRLAKRAPSTAHEFFALKVMLGQVESYPRMMIEGNSLPPFIHSKCALDDTGSFECRERHTCLSEHLSICASLVHLFYTKTPSNSDFVWRTIYEEQTRIHREYPTYDNETLLEAMQAICIYVILQAEDQESQQKNDPQALLESMGALGSKVHLTSGYDDQDPAHPLDRRKWALLESTRRTICLLYIIETLLNVIIAREDPANCQGFGRMPLPCSRSLWEIKSTSQWAKNYREALSKRKSRRVVNIVDLQRSMRLPTSQLCNHEEDESVLNDIMTWCEGLDQFGTLIWMASTVSKCT